MQIPSLTDKKLKGLKPQKKRYRVYIENRPGLFLLVGVTGNITFQFRYQLRGQRREIKIGNYPARTLQNLFAEYAAFVDLVKQDIDPLRERELAKAEAEDNPLFSEYIERFTRHHFKEVSAATAKEYTRQINKYFLPAWGKKDLRDIQRKHIIKLIEKISDSAPVMGNRALSVLKKIFSYAVEVDLIDANPAAVIKPLKEVKKDRVLDLSEIATLFKTLDNMLDRDLRDILKLITLTALRPGEVRTIRLTQLKGRWLELSASDTKTNQTHRVFLNDMAIDIIESRIDYFSIGDYLFPANAACGHVPKDTLTHKVRRLQPITQGLNIEKFTAHDLRRSAATGLARLGYGGLVPDILNHSQRGITRQVYDKYNREPEKERALTSWGEALERAIKGNQADIIAINSNL